MIQPPPLDRPVWGGLLVSCLVWCVGCASLFWITRSMYSAIV